MNLIQNTIIAILLAFWPASRGQQTLESSSPVPLKKDLYELVRDWPKLPDGFVLGNPVGLGIDSDQNLIVFHRADRVWTEPMATAKIGKNTITKIDGKTGELLNSWGGNLFVMPHGLEVDGEDNVWVTDVALHQVFKFSKDGKLLMALGEAGVHGADPGHFYLPTDIAVTPDGSFYVSDGYGNSRVVKYSREGKYLFEWGTFGTGHGQFNTPHGIDLDKEGNVYVADRENNRIQKFDPDGNFLAAWQNKGTDQLYSVAIDTTREHLFGIDYWIIGDTLPKGSDIFRFDLGMHVQCQFGRTGGYDGPVTRYHDIAIDREGNLYTGDILGNRIQKFRLKK